MSLPVSIGDILTLVDIAKSVYEKVRKVKGQIEKAGSKIIRLEGYLRNLHFILVKDKGIGQSALRKDQVAEMETMLKETYEDVAKLTRLLQDFRDKKGPWDTQWASSTAHKIYWATGGGAKELEELSEDLEEKVIEIDRWIGQLNLAITQQILSNQLKQQMKLTQPPTQQLPTASSSKRTGVSILFVDKENTGRGKIAEAYAKLVNQWTSPSRQSWPAGIVHSVGLNVRRRNQCLQYVEKLDVKHFLDGNDTPVDLAMQALFDNKLFNHPYKAKIEASVRSSRSRGPELSLFKEYDYILVFNRQVETNMVRLRQELVKAGGLSVAPKGKGQIKLLGEYGNSKNAVIYHPVELKAIKGELERWQKTVSMIKVAYKGFLKKELGWEQPTPKAQGVKS
ncbi:hypothetical protein BDZ85DRAFT_257483 [Elsinoe ampelina]|uniref:Uncharacterized protein n=1 Tax=Elsinoe ampelina TaxID=302913 RepID=A0A6A6GI94_9PEZI|nr:hypothetical protein BDZ85DRAFT_257483 [Elsinoe ampelina]